MSITDELREWMKGSTLSSWTAEHLTAIADRIDAEHQKSEDEWRAKNGDMWMKGYVACHEELMEGHPVIAADLEKVGWVKLPVDADGEVIHIGDVMERGEARGSVIALMLSNYPKKWGGALHWGIQLDGEHAPTALDLTFHHYHAPTVEDVLREFAEKMNENMGMYTGEAIDADEWRDADAKTIAEYAKRLKLAGGEDA